MDPAGQPRYLTGVIGANPEANPEADDDAQRKSEPPGPAEPGGDVVPRLPRGRGLRLSRPELLRVAGLAILLVFLIVTRRSCADAVSKFVTSFGDRGSAGAAMPRPGAIDRPGSASAAGPAAGPPVGSTAPSAAGSAAAGDGPGPGGYEHLRPGMTDDEVKAVIDRARARSAGRPPSP